jgi:hypothetical protein
MKKINGIIASNFGVTLLIPKSFTRVKSLAKHDILYKSGIDEIVIGFPKKTDVDKEFTISEKGMLSTFINDLELTEYLMNNYDNHIQKTD